MSNSRSTEITKLYLAILHREPDDGGLTHYINSNKSLQEISNELLFSEEAINIYRNGDNVDLLNDRTKLFDKIVIYRNDNICIDYYKNKIPSKNLAFSFSGANEFINLDSLGLHGKRLFDCGFDVVFFKSNNNKFYKEVTSEIIDNINCVLGDQYINRTAIALCMGCLPATKYSHQLHIQTALLLSPNREVGSEVYCLGDNISPTCKFFITCNYNHKFDKINFNYYCDKIPKQNTIKIRIDDAPHVHKTPQTLRAERIYLEFVKQILCNNVVIDHPVIIIDKD